MSAYVPEVVLLSDKMGHICEDRDAHYLPGDYEKFIGKVVIDLLAQS